MSRGSLWENSKVHQLSLIETFNFKAAKNRFLTSKIHLSCLGLIFVSFLLTVILSASMVAGDMMRKSIVFDLKTPKVFYCPQSKPKSMEKLIVRAVPLEKLCEYEGEEPPKQHESDCYNDVDETPYACAEKQRILVSFCQQLFDLEGPNKEIV